MPIPDYQTLMLPLLKIVSDGKEYKVTDIVDNLSEEFALTEDEMKILLPSGQTFLFGNRVGWAKTYLKKAGLIDSQKRSTVVITQRGLDVLKKSPVEINVKILRRFPEFLAFQAPKKSNESDKSSVQDEAHEVQTPEETLESAYLRIRKSVSDDVLQRIKQCSPAFFEKLVVELLVKMGYGGSIKDAGEATKLTGDEGIDGIIKEDKLGLDVIYIQAKRWDTNSVGRPDIQSFVGALDGKRANKGIFITTSTFSGTAIEYVKTISKKVILIDGTQLADYMIDYNLGVSTQRSFDLKRIDNDYFDE